MRIKNQELKFKIYNCLKKNEQEEMKEEELKKVETISINGKDQDWQDNSLIEEDFQVLKYVKCLTLNLFEINDEVVEQIVKLKDLQVLVLNHCQFTARKQISNCLKKAIITYSKKFHLDLFSDVSSMEMIQLVGEENVDISRLRKYKNLETIYLYNSNIQNFERLKDFKKLKKIGLDGSNIIESVCENLKSKGIKLHFQKEYLPS